MLQKIDEIMKTTESKEEKKPNAVEGKTVRERFVIKMDKKTNRIIWTGNVPIKHFSCRCK